MAKKGKAPQTVNKIDNLNVEIDYDKLAEKVKGAILLAENEKHSAKSATSSLFAFLPSLIFSICGWIGVFVSPIAFICFIDLSIQQWKLDHSLVTIVAALFLVFLTVVIFLMSLMLISSANELKKERDKQFVVAVFSAMVSFSALIVALIALLK